MLKAIALRISAPLLAATSLAAQTVIPIVIPGTTTPWNYSATSGGLNSAYQFGYSTQAGTSNGTASVVVSSEQILNFAPGGILTVTYLSGLVNGGPNGACGCNRYTDANGNVSIPPANNDPIPNVGPATPSYYMNPATYPIYWDELVGTFTDNTGSIVGTPFAIGDGPKSFVIPAGASQLQLGVNNSFFTNDVGSWLVQVSVSPAAPAPLVSAVVNAASFQNGPVSPGEIVTISGTNIGPTTPAFLTLDANANVSTTIAQVQVLFNGTPAPLTYVSTSQINAVVPYEIAGLIEPSVQVTFLDQNSNSFLLKSAATAPALFTRNSSGTGPAAILNNDNTPNSPVNPADKESYIALFLTGEGQTAPPGITGKITTLSPTPPLTPQPLLPVAVTIGGQPAYVAFVGEAPGLVSGILQVNVQIPFTVGSGNLPIQVSVGGNNSQKGVTVSVR